MGQLAGPCELKLLWKRNHEWPCELGRDFGWTTNVSERTFWIAHGADCQGVYSCCGRKVECFAHRCTCMQREPITMMRGDLRAALAGAHLLQDWQLIGKGCCGISESPLRPMICHSTPGLNIGLEHRVLRLRANQSQQHNLHACARACVEWSACGAFDVDRCEAPPCARACHLFATRGCPISASSASCSSVAPEASGGRWCFRHARRATLNETACSYLDVAPAVPIRSERLGDDQGSPLALVPSDSTSSLPLELTLVIAHCQEDLSWVSCSWHPRVTVLIFEKCSRAHPGFRRPRIGNTTSFMDLEAQAYRAQPRRKLHCVSYVDSSPRGREAEAYLHFIVASYTRLKPRAFYVFLQAGAPVDLGGPLNVDATFAALRALPPNTLYASLATRLHYNDPKDSNGSFALCRLQPLRLALGHALPCCHFRRPMRAMFVVRGSAVLSRPREVWVRLHAHATSMKDYLADQGVAVGFENSWAPLFGCLDLERRAARENMFSFGSFACIEDG